MKPGFVWCTQMRLLIEEGGANVEVKDRWGNTPLHEAARVGARPCAAYLERCAQIAAQQRQQPQGGPWPPQGGRRRMHLGTPLEETSWTDSSH